METSSAEQATEEHQARQRAAADAAGASASGTAASPRASSAPSGAAQTGFGGGRGVGALRPSDVDFMPGLLRSLSVLMRLRGKPVSPQLLLAGLSGSQITPRACLGAARKAGLSGRIAARPGLSDIPPLVLPCILLLKNDRSCVLTALRGGRAEVIFPEISDSTQTVSQEELQEEYAGYAIFAAVPRAPERRMEAPRLGRGKRWFWDVLRYYAPISGMWPWRAWSSTSLPWRARSLS